MAKSEGRMANTLLRYAAPLSRLRRIPILLLLLLSAIPARATFNIWTPQGQLAGLTGYANPNVIYEGGAKVLSGNVFKMWCTPNNGSGNVNYYESLDGITSWTAHPSNPIVPSGGAAASFPTLYKVRSTYYLYTSVTNGDIYVRTSSDGVTFGSATLAVARGGAGAFDQQSVYQLNLVPNGGPTYYAYYEGIAAAGGSDEGLVTSTDLIHWTKSLSNPIFTGVAPLNFQYINGMYYAWAPDSSVPSSLASQHLGYNALTRWSAPGPKGPWTPLTLGGMPVAVIYPSVRGDFDLTGTNTNSLGTSIGDPYIISALGNMYIYWTRTTLSGAQSGINAAVATGVTPAQQVSSYEGMVGFPIPYTDLNLNFLASDNFQRTNANPIGGNWTPIFGSGSNQLASHLLENSTVGRAGESYYAGTWPNDQWSRVTVANIATSNYVGPDVRMGTGGTQNAYRAYFTGTLGGSGTTQIASILAGTATGIATLSSLKVSLNDVLMLVVSGQNLLLYYNGFPIMAVSDTNLASGAPGLLTVTPTNVTLAQISAWSGGGFQVAAKPVVIAPKPSKK